MLDKLCRSQENVHERVSVEVSISYRQPIIICCLHRQQNLDIETIVHVINKMSMNKQSHIFCVAVSI